MHAKLGGRQLMTYATSGGLSGLYGTGGFFDLFTQNMYTSTIIL